jgi:hypothetical protein
MGTSFLHSGVIVRVSFFLLWRVDGMVGVSSRLINLPQLYSHIGINLQGGISKLMATCSNRSFRLAWSSCWSSDLVRSISRCVAGVRDYPTLAARARWFFWSEDVGPKVVDFSLFSDFVYGRRQILVQDSTGTSP